jgi:UDP-N-acetyl-D-mannosaminuronic acid transferase (WecB/TagA/CpsF family)
MKFHTGGVSFDTAADRRWTLPVARIGGLPVAVIDRALSAELTVDVALARRNPAQSPLIFTSANGQVLSMYARQAQTRELFLNADLIHADGMPLVFVSRFFHKNARSGAGLHHRSLPRCSARRQTARWPTLCVQLGACAFLPER